MTYGPPQRFKAVDIDTGYESGPFDLKFEDCDGGRACVPLGIGEKLYQSTGHHDANGKEVFSCDVLCDELGRIRQFFWNGSGWKMPTSKNDAWPDLLGTALNNGLEHFVIGNVHNSPEQLQAAAEKVRAERD